MRAAIIETFGETPILRDVPEPRPEEGQEVVRVRAAAIKNIERMLAAGTHYAGARMTLPAPIGVDAVVEFADGRRAYTGCRPARGNDERADRDRPVDGDPGPG